MSKIQEQIKKDNERRTLINKCSSFYFNEMSEQNPMISPSFCHSVFEDKTTKELKKYIKISILLCNISGKTNNLYILL